MTASIDTLEADYRRLVDQVIDPRTTAILEHRRRAGNMRRRGWVLRRSLLTADLIALIAAFAISELILPSHGRGIDRYATDVETLGFVFSLPLWVVVAKIYGLYDKDEERTDHSTTDDIVGVFHMVTVGCWLVFAVAWATHVVSPAPSRLALFWASAIALIGLARAGARSVCRKHISYLQNTVIVGAGDVGQLYARKYLKHTEYGINVVGFIDSNPKERHPDLEHVTVLGGYDDLLPIIRLLDVERVVIAFSRESSEETLALLQSIKDVDVQIDIVPRFFEFIGLNVAMHLVEGMPLVGLPPMRLTRSSRVLKRGLDIAMAGVMLLVLSPILGLIALAIKCDSPGPVFYRHRRLGRGGRPIDVVKFRTMRREACRGEEYGGVAAEEEFARIIADVSRSKEFETSYKITDDPRVTRLGARLRRLSIDELPQLWNVLKGDVSLVGPRPITAEELDRYGEAAALLLQTQPGLTGYWQISGRASLAFEDRVRLDLAYITSWSLSLDLTILAKTARR